MMKNMKPIQERMDFENATRKQLLEKQCKKDRQTFSTETKKKLSQKRILKRHMYIERVNFDFSIEARLAFSSEEEKPVLNIDDW